MKHYMQTMANVIDGSHVGDVDLEYFDAKYISVYRNNSLSAHIDVLRANYISVAALVGDEFFTSICLEYIKAYPAHNRTLVGYGEHFTNMIEDNLENHKLPYLSSFAKLDRAWTTAHTARDVEPLDMAVLENIILEGGDIANLYMSIVPSADLVCNDWPVFSLWASLRDNTDITNAVALAEKHETTLVWRHDQEVMYRCLNLAEFTFLDAMRAGGNLGMATSKTLDADPSIDVGQLLAGTVGAKLFTQDIGNAHA